MLGDRDAINLDTFKMYLKGMMEDMREERGFYGTMRESFRRYGSCRSINGLEKLMEEDMIKLKKDFGFPRNAPFIADSKSIIP